MPIADDFNHLTTQDLRERLAIAETVCVLYGWAPVQPQSASTDALTQAWVEWASFIPEGYNKPSRHPELNERRIYELATQRRNIRDRTLRKIRGEGDVVE